MRVALVMPPMRYRNRTNWYEALHNLSKGEPQFVRFSNAVRKRGLLDFRSYPLGLLFLATAIKHQHRVAIFNFLDGATTAGDVVRFRPDVIGFSCSTGSCLIWVDQVSRQLKQRTGATVVLGGPHVTLDPATSLSSTVADFVVAGEGEPVFAPLLDHIAGRQPRLPDTGVWRAERGVARGGPPAVVSDLAQLSPPDHSLLPQQRYPGVHIETSRGCHFSCEFCYQSGFGGCRSYRTRPVDSVVAELQQVASLRPLAHSKVYIVDNNFRDNPRVEQLLTALEGAGLGADYWTATDMHLAPPLMRRMREVGFFYVHTGVESGEPEHFSKVPSRQHVEQFFRHTRSAGLSVGGEFVLLYPGQSRAELRETVAMARRLSSATRGAPSARITYQPHFYRPFPGTALVRKLVARGWRAPETLAGWGWLHDRISRGGREAFQLSDGVSRLAVARAMLAFFALNLTDWLLPNLLQQLPRRLRGLVARGGGRAARSPAAGGPGHGPAARRSAGKAAQPAS